MVFSMVILNCFYFSNLFELLMLCHVISVILQYLVSLIESKLGWIQVFYFFIAMVR